MAKYKAYPEYKDSEVEWLGEIPVEWSITELKRYSWVKGGYAFPSESFTSIGEPVIRIGDIGQDGSINLVNCKFVSSAMAKQNQPYLVQHGELLMAMTGATIGKAGFYEYRFPSLINQRVGVFKVSDKSLQYRYLWYTLKSSGYQEYIKLAAFGGAQPNISDTGMVGYKTVFPSLHEQLCIAIFLDHETAKIDNLIEKQQQLIELLKEKRQAVINHTVTKGLNPNVQMKDSGNDLLGKMPVHWKLTPMRFLSDNITVGIVVTPAKYYIDNGIRCFRSLNISENKIKDAEWVYISEVSHNLLSKSKVYTGDILVVRSGQPGTAAVVDHEFDSCNCIDLIIIRGSERFNSNYVCMQINSVFLKKQVGMASDGAIQQHFNVEVAKALVLVEPPKHEQNEIFKFLSEKNKYFERLIERSELQITLLRERRTALIAAAVTGKIDVRDWVAPDNNQTEQTQEGAA